MIYSIFKYFCFILIVLVFEFASASSISNKSCYVDTKLLLSINDSIEIINEKTIEQIEGEMTRTYDDNGTTVTIAFGKLNQAWEQLKTKVTENDCFFYFKTDKNSWKGYYGREGYILVRNGKPIDAIIIRMN